MTSSTLSLEHLIALNDEMAALVRADVPLDRGLGELGRDLPRALRRHVERIAERLQAGESLAQALASGGDLVPPAYRAVVEAGLRAGRLAAALEGVTTTARRSAELRRVVGLALLYPLLVASLSYTCLVGLLLFWLPRVLGAYDELVQQRPPLLTWVGAVAGKTPAWAPWIPLVVGVLLVVWWYRTGTAAAFDGRESRRWFTAPRRLVEWGQTATFADVLALLLEHEVPLPAALPLAAAASGNSRLRSGCDRLAAALSGGESLATPSVAASGLPAFVHWLLGAGLPPAQVCRSLHETAGSYHRRALRLTEWFTRFLPMILSVVVGGFAVLMYALASFVPWYALLDQLGNSP